MIMSEIQALHHSHHSDEHSDMFTLQLTCTSASSASASSLSRLPTLSRSYESAALSQGYLHLCGVDEAGRGPLAGPVVAAACYIPQHVLINGIHDSKQIKEADRELLYEQLTTHTEVSRPDTEIQRQTETYL